MSTKPIFVATHPRACSTAFERVFMTRRDILRCVHEPFGDAYYFGPERLAARFESDEKARIESGFSQSTYNTIFERINKENTEGKRLLIKDMAQYFIPPGGKPASIAPSLARKERGIGTNPSNDSRSESDEDGSRLETTAATINLHGGETEPYTTSDEPGNPSVVPTALLKQFHWAFLIRHPRHGIPSYYRCCVPPLDKVTGFYNFRPDEAGYDELRRLFDYLRSIGSIGPTVAGQQDNHTNGNARGNLSTSAEICVIDADDLLAKPNDVIATFCKSVGIDYSPAMLNWDSEDDHRHAKAAFEKWKGFHEDAIDSTDLKPRQHKKQKTDEEHQAEWVEKYGKEAAELIAKCVEDNLADYNYLKQFAIEV